MKKQLDETEGTVMVFGILGLAVYGLISFGWDVFTVLIK